MKKKWKLLLFVCCFFIQSIPVFASGISTKADDYSYQIEDTSSKDGMGWILIICDTKIDFFYDVQVTYENVETGEEKTTTIFADTQYHSYEYVKLGTYQITDVTILNEYADYYPISYSDKEIKVTAENLSAVETTIHIEDKRDEIVKAQEKANEAERNGETVNKQEDQTLELEKEDVKEQKGKSEKKSNENSLGLSLFITGGILCGLGICMYLYKKKHG